MKLPLFLAAGALALGGCAATPDYIDGNLFYVDAGCVWYWSPWDCWRYLGYRGSERRPPNPALHCPPAPGHHPPHTPGKDGPCYYLASRDGKLLKSDDPKSFHEAAAPSSGLAGLLHRTGDSLNRLYGGPTGPAWSVSYFHAPSAGWSVHNDHLASSDGSSSRSWTSAGASGQHYSYSGGRDYSAGTTYSSSHTWNGGGGGWSSGGGGRSWSGGGEGGGGHSWSGGGEGGGGHSWGGGGGGGGSSGSGGGGGSSASSGGGGGGSSSSSSSGGGGSGGSSGGSGGGNASSPAR